jgi:hypothetical protein
LLFSFTKIALGASNQCHAMWWLLRGLPWQVVIQLSILSQVPWCSVLPYQLITGPWAQGGYVSDFCLSIRAIQWKMSTPRYHYNAQTFAPYILLPWSHLSRLCDHCHFCIHRYLNLCTCKWTSWWLWRSPLKAIFGPDPGQPEGAIYY